MSKTRSPQVLVERTHQGPGSLRVLQRRLCNQPRHQKTLPFLPRDDFLGVPTVVRSQGALYPERCPYRFTEVLDRRPGEVSFSFLSLSLSFSLTGSTFGVRKYLLRTFTVHSEDNYGSQSPVGRTSHCPQTGSYLLVRHPSYSR